MRIKHAALINASGKYITVLFQLIVSAILARVLSAEDYGIVAIVTVFSTFFATLSDMGVGVAIIQNKDLEKEDIDNIYSFTVYASIILVVMFCIFSIGISKFYQDTIYFRLGWILSISLFFNAINMVPNGIMNRNKKFLNIAIRNVVIYSVSAIIAILLALYGWRYYALVLQSVLTALLTFLWNYVYTLPRFKIQFKISSITKIANYSGFQFAFNIVNYFSRNLDNLLTGKFFGKAELGYYNKAYTLMLYPVNNLSGVVSPVLHPILSDYQEKKDIIYEKYIKVVKLLLLLGIFITPICYLGAYEIIGILYGTQWSVSVSCFKILSIAIITQIINSSAGAIFQALNNTKLLFINGLINSFITIIAILIGIFIGKNIEVLSLCVSIAYILHFCTAFYMLIKMAFRFKLSSFFKDICKEILILMIMIIVTIIYPFKISNIVYSLIIKSIYLGVIYLALLIFTKEIRIFTNILKKS